MQHPWNNVIRNNISRYIPLERQQWFEIQNQVMFSTWLKRMNFRHRLQSHTYLSVPPNHYVNQLPNIIPPSPLHQYPRLSAQPLPRRQDPIPRRNIENRDYRNECSLNSRRDLPGQFRNWRREPNTDSQSFRRVPSGSNSHFNKANENINRLRGRKLQSAKWDSKEFRYDRRGGDLNNSSSNNRSFHMYNDEEVENNHYYDFETKLKYGENNISEYQWTTSQDKLKGSLTKLNCSQNSSSMAYDLESINGTKEKSNRFATPNNSGTADKITHHFGKMQNIPFWGTEIENEISFEKAPPINTSDPYEWLSCEEQQCIVDMLKIEDLNHERRKMQDSYFDEINKGHGDFPIPPVICINNVSENEKNECYDDNSALNDKEDNVVVIVPSDAFEKSVQTFVKQAKFDIYESRNTSFVEIEKQLINSDLQPFDNKQFNNMNDSVILKSRDPWSKYCVGWSTDVDSKERNASDIQSPHNVTSNDKNVAETMSNNLKKLLGIPLKNEILLNCDTSADIIKQDQIVSKSCVSTSEFSPTYDENTYRNLQLSQNIKDQDQSILKNENFKSIVYQSEYCKKIVPYFDETENHSVCYKKFDFDSILSFRNYEMSVSVLNSNVLTINDKYENKNHSRENIVIQNVYQDIQSNDEKQSPILNSILPSQDRNQQKLTPTSYRKIIRYPFLTLSKSCNTQLTSFYANHIENSIFNNHKLSLPNESLNKIINEDALQSSVNSDHDAAASKVLKFILGISDDTKNYQTCTSKSPLLKISNDNFQAIGISHGFIYNSSQKILTASSDGFNYTTVSYNLHSSSPSSESMHITKPQLLHHSLTVDNLKSNTYHANKVQHKLKDGESTNANYIINFINKTEMNLNLKNNEYNNHEFGNNIINEENESCSRKVEDISATKQNSQLPFPITKKKGRKIKKHSNKITNKVSTSHKKDIECAEKMETNVQENTFSKTVKLVQIDAITKEKLKTEKFAENTKLNAYQSNASLKSKQVKEFFKASKVPKETGHLGMKYLNKNCNETTKTTKTNAEIAAEYRARRKAKMFPEKKSINFPQEIASKPKFSVSSLKIKKSSTSEDRSQINSKYKVNSKTVDDKLNISNDKKENHHFKTNDCSHTKKLIVRSANIGAAIYIMPKTTSKSLEFNQTSIHSDHALNKIYDPLCRFEEQLKYLENVYNELCNKNLKKFENRAYKTSFSTFSKELEETSRLQSFPISILNSNGIISPRTFIRNHYLLSQHLVRDLLQFSYVINQCLVRRYRCMTKTISNEMQISSEIPYFYDTNGFESKCINPVNIGIFNLQPPFDNILSYEEYKKFYKYLYHTWHRNYKTKVKNILFPKNISNKDFLFFSWLRHKLSDCNSFCPNLIDKHDN